MTKIGAIIIAAGFSSRMGDFKPLLTFNDKSAISILVEKYLDIKIDQIIVVLGHNKEAIEKVLEPTCREFNQIKLVYNENYSEGMFSSIQKGVKELDYELSGFFMHPVDIPLVEFDTLKAIKDCWTKNKKYKIIYPVFQGKKGHPPLISTNCNRNILQSSGEGGLKNVLLEYNNQAYYLELEDSMVLKDMDVREDYLALKKSIE